MMTLKRATKFFASCALAAAVVGVVLVALAAGDIIFGILDDGLGIVTVDAIRAVRSLPNGEGTIGSTLDRRSPPPRWSAIHDDDDSFFSVRVSANNADWCVAYTLTLTPFPRMTIEDIAPATRAAQAVSGSLGAAYSDLPTNSSWACAAIRTYFKKTSPYAVRY